MATTKQMKSFRLSDDAMFYMDATARNLGVSQTEAVELALEWLYNSGAVAALETAQLRDEKMSPRGFLGDMELRGDIASLLRERAWK